MMGPRNLVVSILVVLALPLQTFPCLILKIAHGNAVLAGNNEDIDNPLSKIWFEPPEPGKYGITYFGYTANYPQGGMNDKGLFFDGVAGYKTDWRPSPQRLEYDGILFRKIMEECATVDEAVAVFKKYNFGAFQRARIFLADRSGASAIVGWIDGDIKAIRDQGNFQAIGFHEETAISMLKALKERQKIVRPDDVKDILEACHQEGRYPTQYSNVCDLKNNVIYMCLFHDYSTVVKFDAAEEYQKGKHDDPLLPLFSDNAKAREARRIYGQTLLDSYQKVMSDADGAPPRRESRELSRLGLRLLDFLEYRKAIDVLKLTAARFPESKSYGNLAFAYEAAGEIDSAIENYEKTLRLDPKDQNAAKSLETLRQKNRRKQSPETFYGQPGPGATPVLFAPEVLTEDLGAHGRLSFSPDGREILFSSREKIYRTAFNGKTLSPANVLPFVDSSRHDGGVATETLGIPGAPPSQRKMSGQTAGPALFFGQTPPGLESKKFGSDILTDGKHPHSQLAFSSGGTDIYWSAFQKGSGQKIFHSVFDGKSFSRPEVASFATASANAGPAFSPDGKRLFFSAGLTTGKDPAARPTVIYYVEKTGSGWGRPVPVEATVGTRMTKGQMSVARSGNIYFSGRFPEERWPSLFLIRYEDGRYLSPVKLGGPPSTVPLLLDPWVDPDERFLLVSCPRLEGSPSLTDIGISFRQPDGSWGLPVKVGGAVNTDVFERFPCLSPDGKYLFFIRSFGQEFASDQAYFYWIDASILEIP